MRHSIRTNGVKISYLDHPGEKQPLVLMHGLTANAHAFDELVAAGLSPGRRVISVDLRGRGLSSKPAHGYQMADHVRDIMGLLDHLGLDQVAMGGHSFGALVTIYLAANYPDRVSHLVLIDAAARLHPKVRELIAPSVQRLGKKWPSFQVYLEQIKTAPYIRDRWLPQMENYYRADVADLPDGGVTTRAKPAHIKQAVDGALGLGLEWLAHLKKATQPALLINATGSFGPEGTPAVLPKELAMETVNLLADARYVEVPGNHLTMLFGEGAKATAKAIEDFLMTPVQV